MQISEQILTNIGALLGSYCGWHITSADHQRVATALDSVQAKSKLSRSNLLTTLFDDTDLQKLLINELVIPETYFFRYSRSYLCLKELAKQWLSENDTGVFRVASIPSATGEECYSIAMMLHEAGIPLERFAVDGVDVSEPLVEHAKQGVYSRYCLRRHPLVEQEKYFDEVAGGLRVKEKIRRRVTFVVGNAKELPPTFFEHSYPVVFCRNLLIYLANDVRKMLADQLKSMLLEDGKLFVGPAEVSFFLQQGLESAGKSQVFLLQMPRGDPQKNKTLASLKQPLKQLKSLTKPKSFKIANRCLPEQQHEPKTGAEDENNTYPSVRALADSGDLATAYRQIDGLLKKKKTVEGFLLQGEILSAMGRLSESTQAMKKVLYIDADNQEALGHLVLICRRSGKLAEAEHYQQCLDGIRG